MSGPGERSAPSRRIRVVDSHTGGEPTRVVIEGGPDLGDASLFERRRLFRQSHDELRTALVTEPRSSEAVVGALLCKPCDPSCAAGAIFFNNVGYLGMCGHGTIGVFVTLAHLGRIGPGRHLLETPAGVVCAVLHDRNTVSFENVPSYRRRAQVRVDVPGYGSVLGDVAWGGNWFFLTESLRLPLIPEAIDELTAFSRSIRSALAASGIHGDGDAVIDHIELYAPSPTVGVDCRNFVLCPGDAYDRSPCGTGTSAKLACLHADGLLPPGRVWRQESVIGSVFAASYRLHEGQVVASIAGSAFVTSEATVILDPADPFAMGIPRTRSPR